MSCEYLSTLVYQIANSCAISSSSAQCSPNDPESAVLTNYKRFHQYHMHPNLNSEMSRFTTKKIQVRISPKETTCVRNRLAGMHFGLTTVVKLETADDYLVLVKFVEPHSIAELAGVTIGAKVTGLQQEDNMLGVVFQDFLTQVQERMRKSSPFTLHLSQKEVVLNIDRNPLQITSFPHPEGKHLPGLHQFIEPKEDGSIAEQEIRGASLENAKNSRDLSETLNNRYWMSDRSAKACYKCERLFTLFNRRHHCRSCGHIFCSQCCTRVPQSFISSHATAESMKKLKKQLVCSQCYRQLGKGLKVAAEKVDRRFKSESLYKASYVFLQPQVEESNDAFYRKLSNRHAASYDLADTETSLNSTVSEKKGEENYDYMSDVHKKSSISTFFPTFDRVQICTTVHHPPHAPRYDVNHEDSMLPKTDKIIRRCSSEPNLYHSISLFNNDIAANTSIVGPLSLTGNRKNHHHQSKVKRSNSKSDLNSLHDNHPLKAVEYTRFLKDLSHTSSQSSYEMLVKHQQRSSSALFLNRTFRDSSLQNLAHEHIAKYGLLSDAISTNECPDILEERLESEAIMKKKADERIYEMVHKLFDESRVLSNLLESERQAWLDLVLAYTHRASVEITCDARAGDKMDIMEYVQIECFVGGSVSDCFYVDGVLCRKSLSHKTMEKIIHKPRILLVASDLAFQHDKHQSHISSLESVAGQEAEYMHIIVEKVMRVKADVIVFAGHVHRLAEDLLLKNGVSVVKNVKLQELHRIARSTGASVISSCDHVDKLDVDEMIGRCRIFQAIEFENPMNTADMVMNRKKHRNSFAQFQRKLPATKKIFNLDTKDVHAANKISNNLSRGLYTSNVGLENIISEEDEDHSGSSLNDSSLMAFQQRQQRRANRNGSCLIGNISNRVRNSRKIRCVVFEDGVKYKRCTIGLRGSPHESVLMEISSFLHETIRAAYNMRLQRSCLCDFALLPPQSESKLEDNSDNVDTNTSEFASAWFENDTSSALYLSLLPNSLTMRAAMKEKQSLCRKCRFDLTQKYSRRKVDCRKEASEPVSKLNRSKSCYSASPSIISLLQCTCPAKKSLDLNRPHVLSSISSNSSNCNPILSRMSSSKKVAIDNSSKMHHNRMLLSAAWSNKNQTLAANADMMCFQFYSSNDLPLGEFIRQYCCGQLPSSRENAKYQHAFETSRLTFTHDIGRVIIRVKKVEDVKQTPAEELVGLVNQSSYSTIMSKTKISMWAAMSATSNSAKSSPELVPTATGKGKNKTSSTFSSHRSITKAGSSISDYTTSSFGSLGINKSKIGTAAAENEQSELYLAAKSSPYFMTMGKDTWNYSFGRFLEDMIYGRGLASSELCCPHLARESTRVLSNDACFVRYFAHAGYVVSFSYERIHPVLHVALQSSLWQEHFDLHQLELDMADLAEKAREVFFCACNKIKDSLSDPVISLHGRKMLTLIKNEASHWYTSYLRRLEQEPPYDIFAKNVYFREMYLKSEDWSNRISGCMHSTVKFGMTNNGDSSPKGTLPLEWFNQEQKSDEEENEGTDDDHDTTKPAEALQQIDEDDKHVNKKVIPSNHLNNLSSLAYFAKKIAAGEFDCDEFVDSNVDQKSSITNSNDTSDNRSSNASSSANSMYSMPEDFFNIMAYPPTSGTTVLNLVREEEVSSTSSSIKSNASAIGGMTNLLSSQIKSNEVIHDSEDECDVGHNSLNRGIQSTLDADKENSVPVSTNVIGANSITNFSHQDMINLSNSRQKASYFSIPPSILNWHPNLPLCVDDTVILVNSTQPTSVIAYSLCSLEYTKKLNVFLSQKKNPVSEHLTSVQFSPPSEEEKCTMLNILCDELCSTIGHTFHDMNHFQTPTTFSCTTFYATQFHALRRLCYGGDKKYVESLCHCEDYAPAGGKSDAHFLKTRDQRFVAKAISEQEHEMFLNMASDYFKYMSRTFQQDLSSMLSKVLGLYKVTIRKDSKEKERDSRSLYIIVMENLFYGRDVDHIFDLKGKKDGRMKRETNTSNKNTLWDQNFVQLAGGIPMPLQESAMSLLLSAIENDTKFLASVNVMDYSMLVGYDKEKQEVCASIIDYIHKYDFLKMVEHAGKRLIQEEGEITVLRPAEYRKRFQKAMMTYFTAVPSRYTNVATVSVSAQKYLQQLNSVRTGAKLMDSQEKMYEFNADV